MKEEVYLVQTDTTVGFLSLSKEKLNHIKNRPKDQDVLITTSRFSTLKNLARVPKRFKKQIRRSKKTTFIYPNKKAIRVVTSHPHRNFLKRFDYLYSTSANKTNESFSYDFASEKADIIVEDFQSFSETKPSSLIKLSKKIKKKLR